MKTCKKLLSLTLAALLVFGMCAAGGANLAVFAADDAQAGETTVKAINAESGLTLDYKTSKTFEFEAENVPEGASVHVFYCGEDRGEGTYINVNDATEDFTVEAKVLASDGSVIAASGEIKVHVKNGFFDRLRVTLRNVFGRIGDAVMDVLGAIFMTIYVFIKKHIPY